MNGAFDQRALQLFRSSSHRESQRLLAPAAISFCIRGQAAGVDAVAAEAFFLWAFFSADGVFAFARPFLRQQTAKPPNGDAPRFWRAAIMLAAMQTDGSRV